jgi:hypothetical protein
MQDKKFSGRVDGNTIRLIGCRTIGKIERINVTTGDVAIRKMLFSFVYSDCSGAPITPGSGSSAGQVTFAYRGKITGKLTDDYVPDGFRAVQFFSFFNSVFQKSFRNKAFPKLCYL